jgi:hypothetical protein
MTADHGPDELDIYGKAELVRLLGVSRQRVDELWRDDPDFPAPALRLVCGPIWRGKPARAYVRARRTRAAAGKGT